ncbi:hypothetical protein J6TS2_19680 [Heyndrickxia sporothermodurans]|nr:hypothetical protein J6TS2_19680 [Heyndrickxia sporothermodurans]
MLILLGKIIAIWYLLIFTSSYLTSTTGAYFNDFEKVSGEITAGIWEKNNELDTEKNGSLKFTSKNQNLESCKSTTISVQIKNGGKDMEQDLTYEVYYIESGNPKNGKKVSEGIISKLSENQSETLSFEAVKLGRYKFKVLENVWSSTIIIHCSGSNTTDSSDKERFKKDGKIGEEKQEVMPKQPSNEDQSKNNLSDGEKVNHDQLEKKGSETGEPKDNGETIPKTEGDL